MSIVTNDTWNTAKPSPTNKLVSKVVTLYGLDGDVDAEQRALEFLDETIMEMNTHLYEFNIVKATGITLTGDVSTAALPDAFYKEKMAFLVRISTSEEADPLVYLDWATFRRLYGENPRAGKSDFPVAYSAKNVHADGLVSLGPQPNAGTASDFTLTIEYYKRIPLASEASHIDLPQEVENAIIYGAKKRLAVYIDGAQAGAGFELWERQALEKLKAVDRRHPDEATRFRLYDRGLNRFRRSPARPVYTRID